MSQPQTPKKARSTATTSAATPAAKPGRAQAIVNNARDVAANAAVEAEKVAKVGAETAKKFALSAADFAVEQGKRGVHLVEDAFEREFNKRYPLAVANVARIRKSSPAKSPAEVLAVLAKEYSNVERSSGTDAAKFIDASALYVLSAVEVHGRHVKNLKARNALVNVVIVGGNPTVRAAAPVIAIGIAMLSKRFRALASAAAVAAPAAELAKDKLAKARDLAGQVNIKDPGKRSIGWAIVRVTKLVLGSAPVKWPAAPKAAPAKPTAKKPVAKPAATKPATKPAAKPAAKQPAPKAK